VIARLENTPVLTTERLTLRAPQASDFEVFAPFVTSDRARYIGGGADKDIGHAWRVLAILSGHWHLRGFGTFVAEDRATGQTRRLHGSLVPRRLAGGRTGLDHLDRRG
jgi:RimJ/RimL family protein N-acetyltransferase